jgi:subtilisin family serine protease
MEAVMPYSPVRSAKRLAAVNMSYGLSRDETKWKNSHCDADWPLVADAVALLGSANIAVVASSGNSGAIADFQNKLAPPACLSQVVSVGSSFRDTDSVPAYSNSASILDFLAPGGDSDKDNVNQSTNCIYGFSWIYPDGIWSAYPTHSCTYLQDVGTSMAAPHVAGAYAVLMDAYPGATISGITDLLDVSGNPVNHSQDSTNYTTPRIDLDASLSPPSAPGSAPASMTLNPLACDSEWAVDWSDLGGTITEYQLEGDTSGSFPSPYRAYVGPVSYAEVVVSATTYFRARGCNTVSCGPWKVAGSTAWTFVGCP